jgi:hypothetical protein
MRVFINDREIGSLSPGGATLAEVIEALHVHVDPGETVTIIEADQQTLDACDERNLRKLAQGIERLRLITRKPEAIASAVQSDVREALAMIAENLERVVGLFRTGDDRGANQLLAALMKELHLALLLDRQAVALDRSCLPLPLDSVGELAAGMLSAQERHAWGELMSLLEGQFVPALRLWARSPGNGAQVASAF